MQKFLWVIILLAILVTACTSTPKSEDIQTPSSTSPVIVTSTPTKEVADNLETSTPTPIATLTITFVPYPEATPLAELLLAPDDILAPEAQKFDFVPGIVDSFLKEDAIYIKDKSYDLKERCQIECTKQIWGASRRYVEIQLRRTENEKQAKLESDELFNSLKPYRLEYTDEYKSWINAPTQNTRIGISGWNNGFVLTTSRGNIVLMIVSYPSPYSDDALHEVSLMAAFANLQMEKLEKANIIP